MPRPKKPRFVSEYPVLTSFIPEGVPASGEVFLSIEELEAIRLSDVERRDQESAADLMQVSRQTYGRILSNARGTVGEALIKGKALRIEGGMYEIRGRRRHRRRRPIEAGAVTVERITGKEVDVLPRRDGRWPQGQRPGTARSRGRGYMARGIPVPDGQGGMRSGRGVGRGQGRGRGRGPGKDRGNNRQNY